MSGISRRRLIQSLLLGSAALSLRSFAQQGSAVEDVVRAGESGSTIIPPHGVPVDQPRLRDIKRVIVDADPGNDDALAILMALSTSALQVDAITVCPGNMGIDGYDQQVLNALYMVDVAGKSGEVPVYRGVPKPILGRSWPVATFIHGSHGLGEVRVTEVDQQVETENGIDAMRRLVNESPGEVTILALGGLTNVAVAMLSDESFAKNLQGVVFVGGKYQNRGYSPGYNTLVDPEAAEVVMRSGAPILLTGDAPREASLLLAEDFDHIASFNTPRSDFFIKSNALRRSYEMKYRGATGSVNYDPMAIAIAADPSIVHEYRSIYVKVELDGEYTRGTPIFGDDIYSGNPIPPGNVDICISADRERFKQMVFDTLRMT